MKSLLVLTLILGSQLVQAAPMDDQIRSLARRVTNNSQMAERLTQDEKIQVLKALNNADVILARVGTDYGDNGPGRDPWPTQPNPNPYPYPYPNPYPTMSCERESNSVYQSTFIKIKNFAYSGAGLNYTDVSAVTFAQDWTRKNPCQYADQYIKTALRLKNFAYSGAGLNYDDRSAVEFALENTSKFCVNYNLEQEFRTAYNFAYSGAGLNMSSSDAANYALSRIQNSAFVCRNNY